MKNLIRENRPMDLGTVCVLILVVIVILGSMAAVLWNTGRLEANTRHVTHTQNVLHALDAILIQALNAETGARGFVITSQDEFLDPYNGARDAINGEVERLRTMITDNPRQQQRLSDLETSLNARFAAFEQAIAARRRDDPAGYTLFIITGKQHMDDLRTTIKDMVAEEHELLSLRAEQSRRSFRVLYVACLLSAVFGLCSVAGYTYQFQRRLMVRDRAAAIVFQEREQLEVTLASIGDGVIATDQHGAVTFLNPVAETLTGWSSADARGVPLTAVFHIVNETTRETVDNPAMRALAEGKIVGLANHTVLIARDGFERAIADSAAPIRGIDGKLHGAILVFRDVSADRDQEVALRSHAAMMTAVLATSLDAIITCDVHGHVVEFNPAAEQIFGYRRDAVLGHSLGSLIVPPNLRGRHDAGMARFRETRQPVILNRRLELTAQRADGTIFPVELAVTSSGSEDRPLFTAFLRDITDRKQTEEHLRAVAADLSEANRRKTEFLATLAHELRNPLAPIRTGLELMKLSAGDPETVEQVRSMMERQAGQMVRLVDDLLDVSRITQGKLHLRLARIDLAEVLKSSIEAVRPFIAEAGHQLTVEFPDRPISLEADPNRLAQIFSNLLSNAAKYTPEGGRIQLAAERAGAEAVVRVKDNGLGIAPEMQAQIFEMFTQIDRPLEQGYTGLGIGLTLVKRLVELHHGRVEVASEGSDRGSEFIVRLPIPAGQPEAQSRGTDTSAPPTPARNYRILVVDDNQPAADMLKMVLKIMGHDVQTAHDGLAGIETAREFQPQVILMDLGMPRLNGYEAAQQIRDSDWGRQIVLIALTGWGQEEDIRRTRDAGFDYHLTKPAEPAALQTLLNSLDLKP